VEVEGKRVHSSAALEPEGKMDSKHKRGAAEKRPKNQGMLTGSFREGRTPSFKGLNGRRGNKEEQTQRKI